MTSASGDAAQSARPQTGSRWPAGKWHQTHEQLHLHLWSAGRTHSRRALSTFGSADSDEQQLAAISVGCAVELLSKSLIARTTPALLSERGDRDTLLHLTDHGHLSAKKATEVRTLSASEAVATATHLHPSLTWRPGADSIVFRVRNAAAHMALVDAPELHSAVLVMLRYVNSILTTQNADPALFWGDNLTSLASELLDEAKSERRRVVAGKLAAARTRLDMLVGRLDATASAVVLASLSGRKLSYADHEEPQACPLCHQQGWLLCGVERTEVIWGPDGKPEVFPTAYPFTFECAVCGLDVEGDELHEFDFPMEIELELEDEPTEPDWEPDEDLLRGR